MGRRALVVLAATVVVGTSPAAASALTPPPGFTDAGESGGPVSDGVRWLAFGRPDGTTEVRDTATGSTRSLTQQCGATAVGTTELVMTCAGEDTGNQQPLAVDLFPADRAAGIR